MSGNELPGASKLYSYFLEAVEGEINIALMFWEHKTSRKLAEWWEKPQIRLTIYSMKKP